MRIKKKKLCGRKNTPSINITYPDVSTQTCRNLKKRYKLFQISFSTVE